MPNKPFFIFVLFALSFFYVLLLADVHLFPPKMENDIMRDIKIIDRRRSSKHSRNDYIVTQSGKEIAILPSAGIVLQEAIPIVVSYSYLLHKPLTIDYAQDNTDHRVASLYLSDSYYMDYVLLALLLAIVYFFRSWYKGNKNADANFYAFIFLFILVLGFQYYIG